jgi:hypothetical protein
MAIGSVTEKSYLSIKPGETKILKKSSNILSVVNYGSVNYTSTCGDFSNKVENALCYRLTWATNTGGGPALSDTNTNINYIEILGTQYLVNKAANMEHDGPPNYSDNNRLEEFLRGIIPQSIMKIYDITTSVTGSGAQNNYLHFQSIGSIADTIMMKITGGGFDDGLYIRPTLSPSNCGSTSST